MERIAYFGGTFDPVHNGHIRIGRTITSLFSLDRFYLMPAFHAPHKPDRLPTSAYHRFAMLCLATQGDERVSVSTHELDKREKRYTVDTLPELHALHPGSRVFFVMGADSWADIRTWREWEKVLLMCDHIVVTRPGYDVKLDHVTDDVRGRVIDLRGGSHSFDPGPTGPHIYFTDAVVYDTSATELRQDLSDGHLDNVDDIPVEVAKYIEKYELYR